MATTEVKLNRTDLTKLLASVMQAEAEQAVQAAEADVVAARDAFHAQVIRLARSDRADLLAHLDGDLTARCTYRIYEDGDEPLGDRASVIFSDGDQEYESDNRVTVRVVIDGKLVLLREQWEAAVSVLRAARARDTRVSAIKDDVRRDIIKAALDTPEGAELLAAAKKCVAVIEVPESGE